MDIKEKAKHEKAVGEGWFNGLYNQEEAELTSEQQGLDFDMVKYWYGREYHRNERLSHG